MLNDESPRKRVPARLATGSSSHSCRVCGVLEWWQSPQRRRVQDVRRGLAIPTRTDETIALIARVKLDATMPRPGAQATKAKPKPKRGKKSK
jgi:hypothetical protein